MHLSDKLASLTRNDTVAQLNEMLNQAHVSVNWWGQRIISVDGYEGTVEINTLASIYLQANAFRGDRNPSLQERLNCCALWGRVQKLYTDSDDVLKRTCLFKYFVPLKEFRPYCRACAGDPMAIIGEWEFNSTKESLFEFLPDQFKAMWPNTEPQGKSWIIGGREQSERWQATKEMVQAALAQRYPEFKERKA